MTSILGIVIVFVCIAGGYLMEHAKPLVLIQPAEPAIIFGSAAGAIVCREPRAGVNPDMEGDGRPFDRLAYTRQFYAESLHMIYDLFSSARKMGTAKLEADVEDPSRSGCLRKISEVPEIAPRAESFVRHAAGGSLERR
jgi:chemotaxis protein MotA